MIRGGRELRVAGREVVPGAVALLLAALYVPSHRQLFRFWVLHGVDLALCLAAGAVSVGWFEGPKVFVRAGRRAGGR